MTIEKLKEEYPEGTKVLLLETMNDSQGVPAGTVGIVRDVDDIGTIHVSWETGSSLGLIPDEDVFKIL